MLFALLMVLGFAFQGTRALWEPDEGRYSDIALQMLDSGDWWVPRLHPEQPHFAKPPLTYWAIAASLSSFGRHEWAVRLPHALAFLLTGLLVFDLARVLGLQRPWVGPLVWATSLGPFAAANLVTPDALLTLFETGAVAAFVRAGAPGRDPPDRRWLIAMWLAFALGFLVKGPPVLLPLAAISAWLVATGRRRALGSVFHPPGVLLFLLLGLGWFALVAVREPRLVEYFVRYEFLDRIFSDVHDRNSSWIGMLRTYGPTLLVGTLPWGAIAAYLRARRAWRNEPRPYSGPDGGVRLLLWLWLLLPLSVFVCTQSRLPLYLLPLFVPIALLFARDLQTVRNRHTPALGLALAFWVVALIAIRVTSAHVPTERDARALAREVVRAARAMSAPMTEIAFVGERPAYGLRFYTDVPVERLTLRTNALPTAALIAEQSVCDEAAEAEHPLWAVSLPQARDFERTLRSCGHVPAIVTPRLRKWRLYEIRDLRPRTARHAADASPARIRRRRDRGNGRHRRHRAIDRLGRFMQRIHEWMILRDVAPQLVAPAGQHGSARAHALLQLGRRQSQAGPTTPGSLLHRLTDLRTMNRRIATRVFDSQQQERFAELSGDWNPLHVDPVTARRLLFGNVVVHGVHLVLWALEEWARDARRPAALASLSATFAHPVPLGQPVDCVLEVEGDALLARLHSAGRSTTSVRASLAPREPTVVVPAPASGHFRREAALEIFPEELHTARGNVPLQLDTARAASLFPHLAQCFSGTQLAELLALTRVVGMRCPGLHSVFGGMHVRAVDASDGRAELAYSVQHFSSRLRLARVDVRGPTLTGRLEAFFRPAPLVQPSATSLRACVQRDEFARQRALVIGGSRGLGEVCAKLLAMGGAEVCLSYHSGAADGRRVVEDIASAGGRATAVEIDVLDRQLDIRGRLPRGWNPSHLYYFATPTILKSASAGFSPESFDRFAQYYVHGFAATVEALLGGLRAVYYPSTVLLDEPAADLAEYTVAKAAGEALCRQLAARHPGIRVRRMRLPRLATDQTQSLVPVARQEAAQWMLQELRTLEAAGAG